MHIDRWIPQAAWKDFKANDARHNCNAAFVDTGILIAADGTEDDLIIKLWPKAERGIYTVCNTNSDFSVML